MEAKEDIAGDRYCVRKVIILMKIDIELFDSFVNHNKFFNVQ